MFFSPDSRPFFPDVPPMVPPNEPRDSPNPPDKTQEVFGVEELLSISAQIRLLGNIRGIRGIRGNVPCSKVAGRARGGVAFHPSLKQCERDIYFR